MPRWTAEARLKQSEAIQQWKPWEHIKGTKTIEGKRRSAMNAYKGRGYDQFSEAMRAYARFSMRCSKELAGVLGITKVDLMEQGVEDGELLNQLFLEFRLSRNKPNLITVLSKG